MAAEAVDDDLPGPDDVKPKKAAEQAVSPPPAPPPPPPPPIAAKKEEPEPTKHTHTQRLVDVATRMGFTQADLDNHPSAVIWDEIERIRSLTAAAPKPAEPAKKEPERDEDEEFIKELEASDTDPKYVAFLKRQHARTKEAEKKAARVDEVEARVKQRDEQDKNDACDAAFAELAKDPKAALLIGTGRHGELDPGEYGWRVAIFKASGIDQEKDSAAVMRQKLVKAGGAMLAKKLGGAAAASPPAVPPPPPPAAPKKDRPRDEQGRFTEEDFAGGKLPTPGNRLSAAGAELNGAAVLHQHMREVGDPRAELDFFDRDDDADLPG